MDFGNKNNLESSNEPEESLKNVIATLAIENMYLSKEFLSELKKVASGERTSENLRQEL